MKNVNLVCNTISSSKYTISDDKSNLKRAKNIAKLGQVFRDIIRDKLKIS